MGRGAFLLPLPLLAFLVAVAALFVWLSFRVPGNQTKTKVQWEQEQRERERARCAANEEGLRD